MVGFLLVGSLCLVAALAIVLFRQWSIDARMEWFEQRWPLKWKPGRAFFELEQLWIAFLAATMGALLILIGIMKG